MRKAEAAEVLTLTSAWPTGRLYLHIIPIVRRRSGHREPPDPLRGTHHRLGARRPGKHGRCRTNSIRNRCQAAQDVSHQGSFCNQNLPLQAGDLPARVHQLPL
ncbi:hypothetical protein MTO96_052205 [Rhipicephalus appendiculatus]